MSDREQKRLIWLILSTLIIRALWTLHPDAMLPTNQVPVYKMFPYSEQLISKPSYFYFVCLHIVTMIYVSVWWYAFDRYRNIFTVWFWIQLAQFIEYFFNYNEAQWFVYIGRYPLGIDLTLLKMAGLPIVFLLYDLIWRKR